MRASRQTVFRVQFSNSFLKIFLIDVSFLQVIHCSWYLIFKRSSQECCLIQVAWWFLCFSFQNKSCRYSLTLEAATSPWPGPHIPTSTHTLTRRGEWWVRACHGRAWGHHMNASEHTGRKSPKRCFILRGIYSCIYLCDVHTVVWIYVFVYVEVSVCTCTRWCVYLCVVCRCGTHICVRTCIHPFQVNPQEGSPNNLGVFSWVPLYRNSVRQQFCSQTWVAGRWPFDVCWAPLVLTWRCAWAGQGALEVSVRLFRAAAWRCLESHLCIALKIGGMGQGVVHWNNFCARRCFWREESMTHLERMYCEHKALRPEAAS